MSEDSPRIVRRKGRQDHAAHHGGSWKIAYADFVTAMMAFFLVMWLISITPREDLKGLAEYFRMPLKTAIMGGDRSSASNSAIPGGGRDATQSDGEVNRTDPSRRNALSESDRRDARRLEDLRRRLETLIERNPVLREHRPQLRVDMTTEGLRIQIVDDQNRPMFESGSAVVAPYMRAILRELGPLLNDMPNRISLSGHTDARPYSQGERSYSNWELSADRANASRRELVNGGMEQQKVMRVLGLSSSMNLVADDPYAAVNRRISLIVLNQATERRIERENAAAAGISAETAASVAGALDAATAAAASAPEQQDRPDWMPRLDGSSDAPATDAGPMGFSFGPASEATPATPADNQPESPNVP